MRSALTPLLPLVALLLAGPSLAAQTTGAFSNPAIAPIGGGEGYAGIVPYPSILLRYAGLTVSTKQQLLDALRIAGWGTTVYVADHAMIDMTGTWGIQIPPGVTLASGRGRNGSLGALIYTRELAGLNLFEVLGDGSRITGLRLRGPDTEISTYDCGGHDSTGISVYSDFTVLRSVSIDNNELWGWPQAAVAVTNVHGAYVHHNHIHHNRRKMDKSGCRDYGLGYGVVVSSQGNALIEANLFDHNRHDIASDGRPGAMYEARYNLVLNAGIAHSFDVHGGADREDNTNIAGTWFHVHHNTFVQSDYPAFKIRGVPQVGAYVHFNEFRHSHETHWLFMAAIEQSNASGNLHYGVNSTGVNRYPAWFVSFGGGTYWRWRRFDPRGMGEVHLADFDGDRIADAFATFGGSWWISRGARGDFQHLNTSSNTLSSLRFGDFDGDGRTDVFHSDGATWFVSYAGTGPWTPINASSAPLTSLGFADLDGDRRTDVFYANGSRWYVSYGGVGYWTQLNVSSVTMGSLRLGDFNGDGRADVFHSDGVRWLVSWGGTSGWTQINVSNVALADLRFADLDGDRRTDVFGADGSRWVVSYGGQTVWQHLNYSSLTTGSLNLGDVNGDGRADVLSRQSL